jgi:aminoglycoside phosphotransferase family enzyme
MFVETSALKSTATVYLRNTEPLSKEILPGNSLTCPANCSCTPQCYRIENIRRSESALLIFVQHVVTNEQFVIKMLREYKDTRYSLETMSKRQECQLEALRWNRLFTPNFYIGLARVYDWEQDQNFITIDEIIERPTRKMLIPGAEYALVMDRLRDDWRLDTLLCEENEELGQCYLQFLTQRVVSIHTELDALPIEDGVYWGGFEQLRRKLVHNLALADPVFKTSEEDQHNSDSGLRETFCCLKDSLLQVITQGQYQRCFEQRVREKRIKRCHGDLKAPNIWIEPSPWHYREPWKYVWILDAIDFNPSYCNIDILSDLAMLIIDIQVRTKSPVLANLMVEDYLEYTDQMDETARSVLDYYLVEKAFVGAAISIVYDNVPDLGWGYLEVARMRMEDLKRWTTI